MVAPADEMADADTDEMTGGTVSTLFTVTLTALDRVEFPAASRASAVRLWTPLAATVVSQAML